jgi:signal recognition particle subunit SRP54
MPPEMMKKLRAAGPQGAQKMMQDMMGGGGGAPGGGGAGMDIGSMMKSMMGGGGGGGGMPNMAQMQGESIHKPVTRGHRLTGVEAMKAMGGGGGGGMPGKLFDPEMKWESELTITDMSQLMNMMGGGR